jgi:6-phosphogluconolactonase (cycloisomerase 2 family)
MAADPAKNNLFLVASQANPSEVQPLAISMKTANTVLLTPGVTAATGAGPGPIAVSDTLIFTGETASVSYYTYSSAGVVGPAVSVALTSFSSGPTCLAVDGSGKHLYGGFNDPSLGGYVQPFNVKGGVLEPPNTGKQVTTVNYPGITALVLHPNGNFLFAACADGTVTVYTISKGTTLKATASSPFYSSPPGFFFHRSTGGLALNSAGTLMVCANNDDSNSVASFSIDAKGNMTQIGNPYTLANANPSSVTFNPSGSVVYVTNGGNNTISALSVSATTGPTPLAGSPYALPAGDTGPGVLIVK